MNRMRRPCRATLHVTVPSGPHPDALGIESLEERQVLSGSTLSINSVTITMNTAGPTSVAGTLNPGDELAAYRIDGTAGEQLQFHSISTSSTSGTWKLIGENDQVVVDPGINATAALGTDFKATLPTTGPYYLELDGTASTPIDYSFQITDLTTYPPPIAASGFDTPQSSSLASGASTTFTFQAPAGLPVYFNNLGFTGGGAIEATLTDPRNNTVFSSSSVAPGTRARMT